MSYLSLNQRAILLMLIFLMAIALLLASAIEELLGDREWREKSVLNHPILQKITKFLRQPFVSLGLKFFFLGVTGFFIFNTLQKAYELTQPGAFVSDFRWYYVASKMVPEGLNPYNAQTFVDYFKQVVTPRNAMPFVYPPNIIPLILPLGYFSSNYASAIGVVANLSAIIFLIWGGVQLLDSQSKTLKVICAIACFLVYGTTYSLSVGNVAAIVSALVVWSIILAKKGNHALAGILLGISTIKPTLAGLFILYFLFKRRFKLVAVCLLTALILTVIGLVMTGNSIPEFLQLYKQGYKLFFEHFYNAPDKSYGRIDSVVIGYRLFTKNVILAKLISALVVLIPSVLIGLYIYRQNKSVNNLGNIYLSEVSLIACLSILSNYSQGSNSSILVLAAVFLIKELIEQIKNNKFLEMTGVFWAIGFFGLLINSKIGYYLLTPAWKPNRSPISLTTIFRQTIASSPSYAILGLTICILVIANLNLNKTRKQVVPEKEIESVTF